MTNLAKTGEIIEKVLRKFMEEKFEREWVGLTDEELVELRETYQAHIFQLLFAVEAKIREKNDVRR